MEGQRPNLACISEEAMEVKAKKPSLSPFDAQDINFPEKFLEELECLENITSCNKVNLLFGPKLSAGGKLPALQRV